MNLPIPPDFALALSRLSHALGDLWDVWGTLAATLEASPKTATLVDAARAAEASLAPLRACLAELAASLPAPADGPWDSGLLPPELTRARLECVLADQFAPALDALAQAADITLGGSTEVARADLECVLVDHLAPAIAALTAAVQLPQEPLPFV